MGALPQSRRTGPEAANVSLELQRHSRTMGMERESRLSHRVVEDLEVAGRLDHVLAVLYMRPEHVVVHLRRSSHSSSGQTRKGDGQNGNSKQKPQVYSPKRSCIVFPSLLSLVINLVGRRDELTKSSSYAQLDQHKPPVNWPCPADPSQPPVGHLLARGPALVANRPPSAGF